MSKTLKNKVLWLVVAMSLFAAMWASWALWGFWRAIYPSISSLVSDSNEFGYGYWYGSNGWWYGYWYGYWVNNDAWYYTDTVTVDENAYSDYTDATNSNISNYLTVSNGWVNVNQTIRISESWVGRVTLPEWLRITGSTTTPQLATSSAKPSSWTKKWAVKFWVDNAKLLFNVPVKIEIPVSSTSNLKITVKHYDGTTSDTLSKTLSTCTTDWLQSWGTSVLSSVSVSWGYATVYTCSASDFIAYTSSSGGGWGGWSSSSTSTSTSSNTTSTWTTKDETKDETKDDYKVDTDTDWSVTITKWDGSTIKFSDISTTFAKDYIAKLAAAGVINGYEDGTFRPENNASRAEYLKIVLKAKWVDYSAADVSKLTFKDVSKDSWIAKVVVKAGELGLIDTTNANFRPNDSITRAESMKMLLNAAWVEVTATETSSFSDVNAKWWEAKYIETAKAKWIVDGQTVNWKLVFRPFSNITRAEVSKIVVKTIDLK